jgi:hypothetical protein
MEQTEFIIPKRFVSPRGVAVSHGIGCALIGLLPESTYTDIVFSVRDGLGAGVGAADVTDGSWQSEAVMFDELDEDAYYEVICEYCRDGEPYPITRATRYRGRSQPE